MASIYQRTNKDGTKVWRAVIRIKNYPTVSDHFDRKKAAEDWAKETETEIKKGKYDFTKNREKTVAELIDLYIQDAVLGHHKAAKDTIHQLNYFKDKLGEYGLVYITPEILLKERKKLLDTPTNKNTVRNPATVNRYFATLGGALSYACKNLRWLDESPCKNLIKLKTKPKERRILTKDEEIRLLKACRESSNSFLYCIVLIALTSGARKSEILNLTWLDIDFENRLAHIRDSKNGRSRRIPLVNSVIQELEIIFRLRDPHKKLVFSSKSAFEKIDIKKSWNTALKKANIRNFVFHGTRHNYCSFGGELGASGQQLRSQMGHSSASSTDHYSHIEAENNRYIGEAIEQKLLKGMTYASK